MYLIAVFFTTLILVTFISLKYRISPFFTLTGGALFFGLLTGLSFDSAITEVMKGMGNTFAAFGIIIFSGSVIAKILQAQNQADDIVNDIRRIVKNPPALSGVAGYLLSIPIACCITAYLLIFPIIESLEKNHARRNILLYIAATASIVSYVLIYPTPVVIPLFNEFSMGMSPLLYDAVALPLSLLLLAGIILAGKKRLEKTHSDDTDTDRNSSQKNKEGGIRFHKRAWAPFIVMFLALPAGFFILGLSHVGIINFVMLAGVISAVILASSKIRRGAVNKGSKHAGLIIFDICGAGGFGYVIIKSGLAAEVMNSYPDFLPVVFIPFIIAALIETAQGSRLVTSIISADFIAQTAIPGLINPISLIFLVSAGACFISFVTDPYFWLIKQTTGDEPKEVIKHYTLPLAASGLLILVFAVILEFLVFA